MTTAERISNIELFVHKQGYVRGLSFWVLPDGDDKFIIEFAKASQRQLATINHTLINMDMTHIRARAQEVIDFELRPSKKKKHAKIRRQNPK